MNIEQIEDDHDIQVVQNNNDQEDVEVNNNNSIKKKKEKVDKDKNSQRSNIQWTDNLVCHLLNLVISEKAHIARKSKSSRLWDKINDAFYDHIELIEYRAELYKFDDHRKVRDKYRNIITAAKTDDDFCVVAKNGEVLRQNDLIKQIIFEMNNHHHHQQSHHDNNITDEIEVVETKRRKSESSSSSSTDLLYNERIQLALDSNSGIITGNRKDNENDIDDKIDVSATVSLNRNVNSNNNNNNSSSSSNSSSRTTNHYRTSRNDYHHHHSVFDAVITKLFNEISTNNDKSVSHESKVEEQLLKWITDHQKNIQSLLLDSNIHNPDEFSLKSLTDLTLEVIINIYCSRNHNFSPAVFKSALIDDMKVTPLIVHKIYLTLEKWRKLCHPVSEGVGSSSSNNSNSSSSNSSKGGRELNMNVKITFN